MAIVDTIITATGSRQPFERPPQNVSLWSSIPRAIVHFSVVDGTLDAKPINDDQHLRISAALPGGFAYQLIQLAATVTQDVAFSWATSPLLRCVNWTTDLGSTEHIVLSASDVHELVDASAVVPVISLRLGPNQAGAFSFGRQPIYNTSGALASFSLLWANESDPAGAAGTVDFVMSFLEFDLTQVLRYTMQSPVPTLSR